MDSRHVNNRSKHGEVDLHSEALEADPDPCSGDSVQRRRRALSVSNLWYIAGARRCWTGGGPLDPWLEWTESRAGRKSRVSVVVQRVRTSVRAQKPSVCITLAMEHP